MENKSVKRSSRAGGLFSLFLVVAMLMAALPGTAMAAEPAQSCSVNYTVKSGDTLSSIAVTYSVNYTDIASANNLNSPYLLTVGQSLCIPGATTTTSSASTTGTTTTASKGFTFTVNGNRVVITASKFSKKTIFFARANDGDRNNNNWDRLGRLRVDKNGNGKFSFQLPRGLRYTTELQVCLKNVRNDEAYCVKQINPNSNTNK